MRRIFTLPFVLALTLFLAACDSAEERAEEHYQSALTLLSEGDIDRAIVELRNVFRLVPNHKEARYEIARAHLAQDAPEQAYRQFLRLVEQYPEELDARIELSEIAFQVASWDELVRHGTIARELDPENDRVKVLAVALDYRTSVEEENLAAQAEQLAIAAELLEENPTNRFLLELSLDGHLREENLSGALALLETLTDEFPSTKRYWVQRLQILLALGDQSAVEDQLVDLVERFPDDAEQKQMLVRYYLSRDDLDKTEEFLRGLAENAAADEPIPRVDLIRFLMERRSIDAARAELVDAIETVEDPSPFIILKTGLDFSVGNTESAIQELEEAIARSEESPLVNDMKVSLARMLLVTGNEVGARARVEEVLANDPQQAAALKMNAAWLIEADDTSNAIAALRTALDVNAEDAEAMTLMADAYLREGSTDLARDFLSLAVEASGNAPEETVRYALLLISEERFLPAEDVLLPALRITPNDLGLLRAAGQLYLGTEDNGRLQQVISTLNRIETDEAKQLAVQFEAELLNRTNGAESALAFLEQAAGAAGADLQSRILLLRGRVAAGDFETAISLAEDIVADSPDRPALRAVLATTLTLSGDMEGALEIYQDLADLYPDQHSFKVEIATLQTRMGQPDAARATIDEALDVAPNDPRVLWVKASHLEQDGDIDDAIAVYEGMYAQDSNNLIVANNLASLIATYRDDDESLELAWSIARRFRDSEIPAIQDTYGWIAHRQGESEEAVTYLQRAASVLTDDPIVQFHFAEALFATERLEDALTQYRFALSQAGVGDTRPQMALARNRISEIEAALAESQ